MSEKHSMSREEIAELVRSIPSPDKELHEHLATLSPNQRIIYMIKLSDQKRLETNELMREQYPGISEARLNLIVLEHLSGDKLPDKVWELVE
jgi:hypothetical protein